MLTKLKSLFKKSKKTEKDNDKLGFISYNLLQTGEIEVKINLKDLEKDSVEKFAKLFARVTTLGLSGYTIELTKKLFMEAGEEKYVQLMLFAAEECNRIVDENEAQMATDNEYIKPSEMFNE
tara:strand:- start:54 stop:419 length:366 start_codon:yes stop_codon:yes gene_type:complete